MNGALLQDRIWHAAGRAADVTGTLCDLYRPDGPHDPLAERRSVLDYGADPTGIADCQFAFSAARDAAAGTSSDTYTVTVSQGSLVLNGVNIGTTYNGTVGDGNLSQLQFIEGPSAAKVFVGVNPTPNGDGTFSYVTSGTEKVSCFVTGTMIGCPGGDRAVEDLTAGDLVLTASGSAAPVVFIGYRVLDLHATPDHRPVRIPAGALADGVPSRDLNLSPDHAVMFDGVLVPARNLLGGAICQVETNAVTYYHIQLERHDVLIAEGAPCETLLDTDDHSIFDNAPEAVQSDAFLMPCLPRITQGPALETILAQIAARTSVTA